MIMEEKEEQGKENFMVDMIDVIFLFCSDLS